MTRKQLLELGLSAPAVDRRLRAKRLHRLHRCVYAVGHSAVSQHGRELAAVLACGPEARLSHQSAAYLHRLLPHPARPGPVHVTVPGIQGRSPKPGIRIHRTRLISPRKAARRHGIPVTNPARTLLDLAAVAGDRELESAVAEAHARQLVTREALLTLVSAARGRCGSSRLRRLITDPPSLTRSEAERRFLTLIRSSGLPAPRVNVRLGPYEIDFLWPAERLAVEVDGFAFHSSRVQFERDRRRDAELAARGYEVLRITWRQIVETPRVTLVLVAQALARR